jgi:hypothetical protein
MCIVDSKVHRSRANTMAHDGSLESIKQFWYNAYPSRLVIVIIWVRLSNIIHSHVRQGLLLIVNYQVTARCHTDSLHSQVTEHSKVTAPHPRFSETIHFDSE